MNKKINENEETNQQKEGTINDFISGLTVKATPEEIEAVQVFSRQLVEDYKYPKDVIQTRPQYRVKIRPSDLKKEYPVDIAVFNSKTRTEDTINIIVECKKKTRTDGKDQLKDYLRFSNAKIGVWFNGEERLFLKKVESKGQVSFEEIPNIPKYGQRLEDIGRFKRKDLDIPHNLKVVFKAIRNHLAGNFSGATRDEELAKEMINLIFCKIYDEKFTKPEEPVEFRAGIGEDPANVKSRILKIFDKVKGKYAEILDVSDKINLDEAGLNYVVGELQNYSLIDSERDVIADAFETFIGSALKGAQGQFFTPRNVVKLMVEISRPKATDQVIDPACGSGGFLVESLKHMWCELELTAQEYAWSELALQEEKTATAINNIFGIEKDNFLSKVAKAYMAIIGDGKGGIFCEDSLEKVSKWKEKTKQRISLSKFNILLTNPPFGKDIKVVGDEKLKQYELGYLWKKEKSYYTKTNKVKDEEAPQVIFIERSLQLLKEGGLMGIVLPETFLHAPNSWYVMEFILRNNNITWVIDLPHNTFRPHNNAKCIVLFLEKNKPQQKMVNMAVAEEIGHNHQGKEVYRWNSDSQTIDRKQLWDDIPLILNEIKDPKKQKYVFKEEFSNCLAKKILVPRYFWKNKSKEIEEIAKKKNLQLISVSDLLSEKVLECFDGHGSPPAEYKGMGEYPYIRVKDIVNWEVYKDPTAKIPKNIYEELRNNKKELFEEDILYVRRGSYRIGSVAMVSPYDLNVCLTREILVLRVAKKENKYLLDPFYLLYLLSHEIVGMQTKNKVLIETTLPNIADRWKEILLPFENDSAKRSKIAQEIKNVIKNKWQAIEGIEKLKKDLGNLNT